MEPAIAEMSLQIIGGGGIDRELVLSMAGILLGNAGGRVLNL